MQCSSCRTQIPVGAAFCLTCGALTPYSVSSSGESPFDPTLAPSPYSAPEHQPATAYGPPPYGVSSQNPYGPPNAYAVPPQVFSPQQQQQAAAKRGGCLTSWLVFIVLVNALTLSGIFSRYLSLFGTYGVQAGPVLWYFIVYVLLDIAYIGGAIALFLWRRWGFYLLVGCAIVTFFLNIFNGLPVTLQSQSIAFSIGYLIAYLAGPFIGLAILFWLLRRDGKWALRFH